MHILTNSLSISSERFKAFSKFLLQVVCGSFFLSLCARISIPLDPVPMSLQTFGIFILAITLGGKKSALAALLYLVHATMGFPVLAGGISQPLWMFGIGAGYLLAFPIASYVIGTLSEKRKESSLWTFFSIFCGQLVILLSGSLFLARFIGFKNSWALGVVPFLFIDSLKLIVTFSISGVYPRLKKRFIQ
jgi:biotin transport system substrate-specific component